METIIKNSIEKKLSKTNVPFWAVTYNGNMKATIWDEQIADYLTKDIADGASVMVEITSKGNYNNIRAVDFNGTVDSAPVQAQVQAPVTTEAPLMSARDASIVAQVCLKGAVELAKDKKFGGNEDLGEYLCMAVNELAGAYRVALKSLE